MTSSTIFWGAVIVVLGLALFAVLPDPPSLSFLPTLMKNGLDTFAHAIAFAEGYGADLTNVPTRANNPGDLKLPGSQNTTGAEDITVFPTIQAGWDALTHQLALIVDGKSHIYTVDMSIFEMAAHWTDTQADAWTANVVSYLQSHGFPNVTASDPIGSVLNA